MCPNSYSFFIKSIGSHWLQGRNFGRKIQESINRSTHTNNVIIRAVEENFKISANIRCHQTVCLLEITIFEFIGPTDRLPNIPPGGHPYVPPDASSQAGNIALIIPSRMLPQLDQERIQEFMDGKMAIKLQARTAESPIQFILPPMPPEPNNATLSPEPDNAADSQVV